ncbi:MAG TPA: hypothetical protein VFG01_09245, partial [Acidobacteriota bacterium]|nr:hypothetical protein [Acidobacteriota bacterium]
MLKSNHWITLFLGIGLMALFSCSSNTGNSQASGNSSYDDLVKLFKEWREFQKPAVKDGVPDYTAEAMAKQHIELKEYQNRLKAIDPS